MFDKYYQDEEADLLLETAHYINDNYLGTEGQYQVQVQEEVKRAIQAKFMNL